MCRGTLRIRSNTERFVIPWSLKRCTSRSRVRADVIPIPAKRTSAIDTFQPTLHNRQRGVSGQIDLQRGHRDVVLCNGGEVGSGAGIVLGAGGADPVYGAA